MMAQEEGELPSHPPREKLEMAEQFQFLRCEECQSEVHNPKLLPCFHNLCTECLQKTEHTGFCVTCQAPHSRNAELPELQDNLLFSKLQATLRIYQKIMEGDNLTCDCEKEGQLWCSDCASFLCHSCFESHQRFLKGENHEARLLGDIRAEMSHKFLSKNWKQSVLFCPKTGHQKKILSIYCKECQQFLCCTCALLDFGHVGKQCDIREEIQKRQEELQAMSMELKEKKQSFEDTRTNLEEQRKEMKDMNQKTKEQIHQKVEEMVQVLREKEATFLEEIEEQYKQQIQDVEMKLQDLEGVLKRLDSSVKLVEKMDLYASDQQFLEMHPFIRGSLENLQQKQPPAVDSQIEAANSVEVKKQLQVLFERVTKDKEDVPSTLEMTPGQDHVVKSPVKRTYLGDERATSTPPKMIKTEREASEGIEEPISPASCSLLEQPRTSSESAGCGRATRSADNTEGSTISYQRRDSSSTEISDAGSLTLGGPSDDLDGLGGLSTEEQHTLRVQPPCQARQSTPTEVFPSMPPSPVLDLSLAGLYEQSPRQLDIVHKEFYACEDPYTEPPPQLAEGYDAKDFYLGCSSGRLLPRSGQNTGSSEDGSGRTTVNIMEEEEEQQGWLGERHDPPTAEDLRFQEPPLEAEGCQEIEEGVDPTLFSHAPNPQLPVRLPQYTYPLWAPVDWGWLEGVQTWQEAFREVLRIFYGYMGTLSAQLESFKIAIERQNSSVAEEFKEVHESLASLMDLGRNMNSEITQLSPLIQEALHPADVVPGRYAGARARGHHRGGQSGRGRGQRSRCGQRGFKGRGVPQ